MSGRELTEAETAELERWRVFEEAEKTKMLDDLRTILYFGGSALDGLAIVETMRTITSPVMTFCLGYAFSMALVILAAGESGSRFCTQGSWVMMHQIFYERLNTQLAKILADSSGQRLTKIEQDMREDVWMAAEVI